MILSTKTVKERTRNKSKMMKNLVAFLNLVQHKIRYGCGYDSEEELFGGWRRRNKKAAGMRLKNIPFVNNLIDFNLDFQIFDL